MNGRTVKNSLLTILIVLSAFFAWPHPSIAQDSKQQDAAQVEALKNEYRQLLALSYQMPDNFDFKRVREIYAQLPDFNPYKIDPKIDFINFFARIKRLDTTAQTDMKIYIARHFALPEVHKQAIEVYKTLGDTKQAAYHQWAWKKLMEQNFPRGRGQSRNDAYKVLVLSEEETVAMESMSALMDVRVVVEEDGKRIFDVQRGVRKTGYHGEMWFDTTAIWHAKGGPGLPPEYASKMKKQSK